MNIDDWGESDHGDFEEWLHLHYERHLVITHINELDRLIDLHKEISFRSRVYDRKVPLVRKLAELESEISHYEHRYGYQLER